MKTTIALLALFAFVLGGGYALYVHIHPTIQSSTSATQTASTSSTQPSVTASPSSNGTTPAGPKMYTSAEVAAHNTSSSCWTIINGTVYDLTTWIFQHPGGEGAILSICGVDGTQAFEGQHGNPRDTRPQQLLAGFKVGTLAP